MCRESGYYIWLRDLVGNRQDYRHLVKQLDSMEYVYIFTMDANRAAGGMNLRTKFAYEASMDDDDVRTGPCTVLEMLIGVSMHMVDTLSCDIETWFWTLMDNLSLTRFDDDDYDSRGVEYIVNTWLHHKYCKDGTGSIFPLKNYPGDCRNMDVWTAMNAWILENYPVDDSWLN